MTLIICSECGKEVSDRAISCPHCGVPICGVTTDVKIDNGGGVLTFPELPQDLNIGQQIVNWSLDAAVKGFYDRTENTILTIPHGKINIALHAYGLQVWGGLTFFSIHNSQIISLKTASRGEIVSAGKSVVGRAAIGGLILGPLGAIIGGMSGIGTKEQFVDKHYIIINYWDINTRSAQSLLISGDAAQISSFIQRHEKEKQIERSGNKEAPDTRDPMMAIVCIALLVIVAIIIGIAILG
jgi:hypothetical protein